jgi:glyoxylase-like metal-dependent hydrolase (beta-lactamase superfamily II)
MQLVFEQVPVGGDRNFGYLLGDRDARQGVLIDPSYAPGRLVERARAQGLTITHIINTHGHPDHTNGNDEARRLTGAPVAAFARSRMITPAVGLSDGSELAVGGLRLRCRHVPGHCDDHLTLFEPAWNILFTGDLIFVGKVGGTGSDEEARTEWASLQAVLAATPGEATVWPGHDYGVRPSSTIAIERATNPFLKCADANSFLSLKENWTSVKINL